MPYAQFLSEATPIDSFKIGTGGRDGSNGAPIAVPGGIHDYDESIVVPWLPRW